jgi:hypothetical protein
MENQLPWRGSDGSHPMKGIEGFTNGEGEYTMNSDLLRQMFGLQSVPMFDPEYYLLNEVVPSDMYDRLESDYRINVFREMLVTFSQKGE